MPLFMIKVFQKLEKGYTKMDIIYSSSYDRTGIKDYAIFKNVNLTQLNNKVAYLKNILIYRYMHTKKY